MTRLLAVPLGFILKALYGLLGNYALTIVVFTVIIRLIILPLYAAQMRSSEQMQAIQPLVKEIQTKYANDKETMGVKMQELYEEHKIRPAMGCLPLLIQLPIIWGLFGLLRSPLEYLGDNATMVLAVHEPFFWVNDLCQPDNFILPIIAGIATFISMMFSFSNNQVSADNPAATSMKSMQYIMPVMIAVMGTTMPAGLTLYWIISYIFQIFQIKVTRTIRANRKPKKKKKKKKA